jgi:hypothetical protein
MTLRLSLYLPHARYAPGETVRPEVILANRSPDPLPAPNLHGDRGYYPRFVLTRPPGLDPLEFSLGRPGDPPPAPETQDQALLEGYQEDSRSFPLSRLAEIGSAGEYTLTAYCQGPQGRIESDPVRWVQEGPAPLAVAVPAARGAANAGRLPCYHLFQGQALRAIYRDLLGWDEEQPRSPIFEGEPERVLELDAEARQLSAISSPTANPPPGELWIAWLQDDGVHAGVSRFGFVTHHWTPEFPIDRLAAPPLALADGGCDVAVLGRDGISLGLVRFEAPVLLPPPPLAETPTMEDTEPPPPGPLEELPVPNPLERIRLSPARLAWRHEFAEPPQGLAIARGVGTGLTAIGWARQREDGVELCYGVAEGDTPPERIGSVLVPDVQLLPESRPALALDRQGNGHLCLLMQGRASGPDGPPRGMDQVVVSRVAFDRWARPRIDHSLLYRELAPLPGPPRAAALSYFINDHGGPWIFDWAVLLDGDLCLVSSRFGEPHLLRPQDAIPCRPLGLLSYPLHAFLLAHDGRGARRFIGLG